MAEPEGPARAGRNAGRPCPLCGKPAADRWRPFCSKRCADIDLGRWLDGRYRIAGSGDDEPEDGAADPAGGDGDGDGDGGAP